MGTTTSAAAAEAEAEYDETTAKELDDKISVYERAYARMQYENALMLNTTMPNMDIVQRKTTAINSTCESLIRLVTRRNIIRRFLRGGFNPTYTTEISGVALSEEPVRTPSEAQKIELLTRLDAAGYSGRHITRLVRAGNTYESIIHACMPTTPSAEAESLPQTDVEYRIPSIITHVHPSMLDPPSVLGKRRSSEIEPLDM